MTAQTKRDIEFGVAVLIVAAFVVTGFISMCWWLICLIGRTQP
ncbi:MAG: hypothetical protein ACLQVM_05175 [Terriglobia bacterium]